MPGETPIERVFSVMPFKPQVIQNLDCQETQDGQLACQVELFGSAERVNVKLRENGLENMRCTRTENGDLACEAVLSEKHERVNATFPKDLLR
jgi:hypothetical protein